jgi:hypothetical protein
MEERLKSNEDQTTLYQNHMQTTRARSTGSGTACSRSSEFGSTPQCAPSRRWRHTGTSVLQYLGLIEQRVNEILQVYAGRAMVLGEDVEHLRIALESGGYEDAHFRVMIAPPSANEYEHGAPGGAVTSR